MSARDGLVPITDSPIGPKPSPSMSMLEFSRSSNVSIAVVGSRNVDPGLPVVNDTVSTKPVLASTILPVKNLFAGNCKLKEPDEFRLARTPPTDITPLDAGTKSESIAESIKPTAFEMLVWISASSNSKNSCSI